MINTSFYIYGGVILFIGSIGTMLTLHKGIKTINESSDELIHSNFEDIKSELSKEGNPDKLHTYVNTICVEKRRQIHLIEDVRNVTLCLCFSAFILIIMGLLPQTIAVVNGFITVRDSIIELIVGAGSAIVGMLFLIAFFFVARIVREFSKMERKSQI